MHHITPSGHTIPLLQSIHNTGKPMTKVALIPSENYQAAMDQFGVLHPRIRDKVSEAYHGKGFVEGKQVVLTSGYRDTFNSCKSSNYASELLHLYNP
jgi:hypothetical protein